jgi:pimeloyl-ACP methyl ester carboxylesterase
VKRAVLTALLLCGVLAPAPAQAFTNGPASVDGANDWTCKPTRKHPYPVVLIPGTFGNVGASWAVISPLLAKNGYCVFAFNYGMSPKSLGWLDGLSGLGDIAESAATMRGFVEKVVNATGSPRVDVVGHSQGGMMPNYYIKRLGGDRKIHTLIGLAPSNHGTTSLGLVKLARSLHLVDDILGTPSLEQQEQGSEFQRNLFGDGDTVPGPRYVVVETDRDIIVTPHTNAFLKGAQNILIQKACPHDYVGHIGMFTDGPTIQFILNALGANRRHFRPVCQNYGLPF